MGPSVLQLMMSGNMSVESGGARVSAAAWVQTREVHGAT